MSLSTIHRFASRLLAHTLTLTLTAAAVLLGALTLVQTPALADADEMETFVWSRESLKLIASGDVERGRELADSSGCYKCHGEQGIAEDDETPSIAGQERAYAFKQLIDYKTRARDSRDMYKKVRRRSDQELADLAAYYETLPAEPAADLTEPPLLVTQGDKDRLLLPCGVCHGEQGEGFGLQVPALAGQKLDHFIETMLAFRNGERENDDYGRMRFIASQLSAEEIETLAAYYAAAPTADTDG